MSFFTNRRQSDNDTDKQPAKPIPQHPVGFETVLGAGSSMEGSLSSKGNIRLDGDFTGSLDIQGNVLVGETAKINADIDARNISIAGAVRGNITGNKIQLLRTGRIWGDITANALTTEEGAFIDGKITMKSHEANRPPSSAKTSVEPTPVEADKMIEDSSENLSPLPEPIEPSSTVEIEPSDAEEKPLDADVENSNLADISETIAVDDESDDKTE
jgi:cytoskeletal protein CcmA (bactofilin family)